MNVSPEWVTAIAAGLSCLSLVLLFWQVRANHDRARREKALDILTAWDRAITRNHFRYANLLAALPSDDVALIHAGLPLSVKRSLVEKYLPELAAGNPQDPVVLEVDQVLDIRTSMLNLLNTLENVSLAFKHGVADREILAEAFYNFLIEKKFLDRCRSFMVQFGNSWPSLNEMPALVNPPKQRKPAA